MIHALVDDTWCCGCSDSICKKPVIYTIVHNEYRIFLWHIGSTPWLYHKGFRSNSCMFGHNWYHISHWGKLVGIVIPMYHGNMCIVSLPSYIDHMDNDISHYSICDVVFELVGRYRRKLLHVSHAVSVSGHPNNYMHSTLPKLYDNFVDDNVFVVAVAKRH